MNFPAVSPKDEAVFLLTNRVKYFRENFPNPFRHDEKQDVLYKTRKSYLIAGAQYRMQGYDALYFDLQRTAEKYLDKFDDTAVEKHKFQTESFAFDETHAPDLNFADKYGLNPLLAHLALLYWGQEL